MTSQDKIPPKSVSATETADPAPLTAQASDVTLNAVADPASAEVPAPDRTNLSEFRRDGTPRARPLNARVAGPGARVGGPGPGRGAGTGVGRGAGPAAGRATARRIEQDDELRERRIEKLGGRRSKPAEALDGSGVGDPLMLERAMPPVRPAKMRKRHYGVLVSMIAMVILPLAVTCWYLWTHAVDQYESHVGFAVRAEGQTATPDLFGGLLGAPATSTSEDMYILNEYILSQEIVTLIDAKLDLRKRFSLPATDPVYAFDPDGTIEDLVSFWQRMVVVNYDSSSGLMDLTVYAFTPQDAQDISAAVLEESGKIINNLSAIARDDSTRYAREALETARARATEARAAISAFRAKNQVADPSADVASQMGVVSSLQHQLATALVELDLLLSSAQADDPRILQLQRRIAAIEGRIEKERSNMGIGTAGSGFADVLSEYERLTVEKTFAETAYVAALAGFDAAMASASQQSRYLASYVSPTLAQASTAPVRPLVALVIGLIAFFIWASVVLIYYALRDRR